MWRDEAKAEAAYAAKAEAAHAASGRRTTQGVTFLVGVFVSALLYGAFVLYRMTGTCSTVAWTTTLALALTGLILTMHDGSASSSSSS